MSEPLSILASAPPGLEPLLAAEASEAGFDARVVPGGVEIAGGWAEAWRANLDLRGAGRVLVRIAEFRAMHPAQLDKRARKVDWAAVLRPDVPVRVEAVCRASRIYHAGAAKSRVAQAIEAVAPVAEGGSVRVLVRIEDDLCTISVDTSGEPLHRRGHKEAVGKAPMRETLAALFLRACGYRGEEPVVDPMCGSGTFVIEAAGIAMGLQPGAARCFAFERLARVDHAAVAAMRRPGHDTAYRFHGADRDQGAVRMARANAERAGVGRVATFARAPISDLHPPGGPPGLVIVNPPYGGRIGERKVLFALYGTLGKVLVARFAGWRVGLVTSDPGLAKATALPWRRTLGPVDHGGTPVQVWQSGPLA